MGQTCEQRLGDLDLYSHAVSFSLAVGQVGDRGVGQASYDLKIDA